MYCGSFELWREHAVAQFPSFHRIQKQDFNHVSGIKKVVWLVFSLLCLGILMYNVIILVIAYFEYPVGLTQGDIIYMYVFHTRLWC